MRFELDSHGDHFWTLDFAGDGFETTYTLRTTEALALFELLEERLGANVFERRASEPGDGTDLFADEALAERLIAREEFEHSRPVLRDEFGRELDHPGADLH